MKKKVFKIKTEYSVNYKYGPGSFESVTKTVEEEEYIITENFDLAHMYISQKQENHKIISIECICEAETFEEFPRREWTAEDIPVDLPMAELVHEWAKGGRTSEMIFGVINFLTHFKPEKYVKSWNNKK